MKNQLRNYITSISLILLASAFVQAQQVEVNEIEALYDQFETKETRRIDEKISRKKRYKKSARPKKQKNYDFSELGDLEPLADIAIIQRRFLPTTGRYEFSALGVAGMNNTFFNNIGANLTASYFFTSKYAVEVAYFGMSPSKKDFTNSLESPSAGFKTIGVFTKSYMGASFKWNPFYGKVSFLNDSINNFDTYFTVGGGSTTTESTTAPTFQFGVGQVYAISKSIGFKVDLSCHMYSAESETGKISQTDIFLGLGASFYFPEATYR